MASAMVLALVLVVVEIGLRISGLGPSAVHTVSADEFERIPGMYSPGQRLTVRQIRELPYEMSVNSLGFRGEDFPVRKPAEEIRIVVIGDSIVVGEFVDDQETLPAQLEAQLRRNCPRVRVVNAGLSGSSLDGQLHVARRTMAIEPDLVVLVYSENDVAGLDGTPYWDQLADARRRKSRFPMSMVYAAGRDTAIWTALLRARANLRALAGRANPGPPDAGDDLRRRDELRTRYEGLLEELRDALDAQGIPLVTAAFPSHLTIRGLTSDEKASWFASTVTRHGLPYVDLFGWFGSRAESIERFYLLPWDGHPSPLGHATAAVPMARDLLQLDPLASHCRSPSP